MFSSTPIFDRALHAIAPGNLLDMDDIFLVQNTPSATSTRFACRVEAIFSVIADSSFLGQTYRYPAR